MWSPYSFQRILDQRKNSECSLTDSRIDLSPSTECSYVRSHIHIIGFCDKSIIITHCFPGKGATSRSRSWPSQQAAEMSFISPPLDSCALFLEPYCPSRGRILKWWGLRPQGRHLGGLSNAPVVTPQRLTSSTAVDVEADETPRPCSSSAPNPKGSGLEEFPPCMRNLHDCYFFLGKRQSISFYFSS